MTDAKNIIIQISPKVFEEINAFSSKTFLTRGGRIGSGMGMLLEALWGYFINIELKEYPYEIAWFPDHQYNDFACLHKEQEWKPESKEGEALRIEVKSMNKGADESKAHFDVLSKEIGDDDLLLVIVWEWRQIDSIYFAPIIIDHFINSVQPLIKLRDSLHLKRGGSFVDAQKCPDGCTPKTCSHFGEPLNAAGKRERLTGPLSCKPSANVSYAANFGGLIRMLKTSNPEAFEEFRKIRKEDEIAHKYISFIHTNYIEEELNQYPKSKLDSVAIKNGLDIKGKSKAEIHKLIRESIPEYQDQLRNL
ncbi:MAG: hypothetical protein JNJ86_00695 [Chitinophagaceae bacterium]|nr:hypothetical protein [Chitinophagaceae bacterium]